MDFFYNSFDYPVICYIKPVAKDWLFYSKSNMYNVYATFQFAHFMLLFHYTRRVHK